LKEVMFQENQVAPVGATIALIEVEGEAAAVGDDTPTAAKQEQGPAETSEVEVPYVPTPSIDNSQHTDLQQGNNGFYSPLVMSIASKEGIDLTELASITGTG